MSDRPYGGVLQVEALTGTIGGVVTGVDLSFQLAELPMASIEQALHDYGVLFFPDQRLEDHQQIAFASWFGELDVHMAGRNDAERPEIYVLEGYSRDIEWHADVTFSDVPPRASVLRAVTVPSRGGDTLWSSTCASYEALSSSMQRLVDELHAAHDSSVLNLRDPHLPIARAVHPVVIDHPGTGRRSVFVNPMFTKRILELTPRESERVLAVLYDEVRAPSHQVRLRWQPNTIAMWDNLATQHFVVVDYSAPRVMRRVTVRGSRPVSSRTQLDEAATSSIAEVEILADASRR